MSYNNQINNNIIHIGDKYNLLTKKNRTSCMKCERIPWSSVVKIFPVQSTSYVTDNFT